MKRVSTLETGPPQELWYTPSSTLRPRWDEAGLRGYDRKNDSGQWIEHGADDFVQLRRGQQPGNPFLGVSPLEPLGMEVWMAREGKRMTAAVLKNLGIIGLILSLKGGEDIEFKEGDVKRSSNI